MEGKRVSQTHTSFPFRPTDSLGGDKDRGRATGLVGRE